MLQNLSYMDCSVPEVWQNVTNYETHGYSRGGEGVWDFKRIPLFH